MSNKTPPDYGEHPAFPVAAGNQVYANGLTIRDWLAGQAPITFEVASQAYGGDPHLTQDTDRAAFFAVWAMLRYEWADAMINARVEGQP